MKILIVEDELIIANYMKQILEDKGHEVLEPCVNYAKAIFSIVRDKPDLVLLDIHIDGDKDGFYIAEQIRKNSEMCIIFVSGNTSKPFFDKALKFHPNGFLSKPVNPIDLQFSVEISYANYKNEILKRNELIDLTIESKEADSVFLIENFIHDLTNPLIALRSEVERGEGIIDEKRSLITDKIKIIQGLLNSFRKTVQHETTVSVHDINSICKKVQLLNEFACESKGFSLEIQSQEQSLKIDESEIIRILSNLINNALQANMDNQEKWIRIDFENTDKGLECSITDSGSGIPLELREKIFQKKFTTNEHLGGSGIGLYSAKESLKEQGFDLRLNPDSPNTQFVISFY